MLWLLEKSEAGLGSVLAELDPFTNSAERPSSSFSDFISPVPLLLTSGRGTVAADEGIGAAVGKWAWTDEPA